ncbi:MAG: hypothetical protein ACRCXZ_01145, partial [Patescibacteria group bacterium]
MLPIIIGSTAFGQTNNGDNNLQNNTQQNQTKDPVVLDNVLIPGCRLNNLVGDSTKNTVTDGSKAQFLKSCIQGGIRLFIIFALIAAVFNLALNGVAQMVPFGGANATSKSITNLRNLVIGLFLVTVGWNLIPILNASFGNSNFLSLPALNPCSIKEACESPERAARRDARTAIQTYEKINYE